MVDRNIFRKIQDIRNKALAKYSHFNVGAGLETTDGKLYLGHNIESSSYGLTICAERVALFKALSEGERDFRRIYILANNEEFCPPCGACRQLLIDYAPNIEVILLTDSGAEKSYRISELLPEAFTEKRLK
ncbi:cytidine deaminase [candidate division KSB1 bacterium 4484_188]|nr:MAG: cytidine deaminase [candidate division KSB1 bacterium 4484_188]HFE64373.1 cytidine deaminase [Caldithrix sp.]